LILQTIDGQLLPNIIIRDVTLIQEESSTGIVLDTELLASKLVYTLSMSKHISIAILTNPKILLLKRRDVRLWAFPVGIKKWLLTLPLLYPRPLPFIILYPPESVFVQQSHNGLTLCRYIS